MADIFSDKPSEANMSSSRLTTFQPRECSTEGGESLVITFSEPIPNDSMIIILRGSECTHKLHPERIDDHVLAALLPAHSLPELVRFTVYWLPSTQEHSSTYRAVPLMEDAILYTDQTRLLAEQLVLSVVDATQSAIFYSLLPPLASMNITMSCEFDVKLTDALKQVKMPKNWNMVVPGHNHHETLLHFASKNNLPHLFSLLLTLPGGKEAVMVANKQGKYPIDLAKESGSHEITRIIEGLERESSPFASIGANVTVPSLSLPDSRSSPYLNIMKEIDDVWISNQRQHKNGLNIGSPPPQRGAATSNHYSKRPNSIAVMEGLNSLDDNSTSCCWLCVKEKCRKKSWSKVVGESTTRSVDTGMNELDRITDQILAHERLQDVRNMKNTTVKGEWLHRLSFSCPVLNDEVDLVSNNLIHSTLTSPGLFDGPAFSSAFSAPAYFKSNSDPLDSIPHQSLDTINTENEGAHSTSPNNIVVPQVCIEDEQHPGVCLSPPNSEGGDDSTLKADGRQSPYQYGSDSGDSDDHDDGEEDENMDDGFVHLECPDDLADTPPKNPLSSKSAPTLQSVEVPTDSSQLTTPLKFGKSISTADTNDVLKVVNSKSPPGNDQLTEESSDDNDDDMKAKSAICLSSSPNSSPSRNRTTPNETTPSHEKTHQKSHSVSGILLNPSMLDEASDQSLSVPPISLLNDDCRSRGSSFISTSSKPDDTSDSEESDDEEEDFEPRQNSSTDARLLGLKKIKRKEDEVVSSEDDYLDGEDQRGRSRGRMGRRLSEVKVTMIDEVSDDEVIMSRPLPRSSTADDALSHSAHSSEDRKSTTPHSYSPVPHKNSEIQLSDINVSVESLNNSFPGDNSKPVPPPQSNESPVFVRGASRGEPFTPNESPNVSQQSKRFSDPKSAVKHLQSLLKLEIDQEESCAFSDDSDVEANSGKQRRRSSDKSQTLPIQSPGQMRRRSPLLSQSDLKPHAKVVRNSSTASDTKVSYKREPECSSLDFVKPQEGQSSPRSQHSPFQSDSYTVNQPQSPLFFSKRSPIGDEGLLSPKGQGSPMEKRISRSADNLLSDPPKSDEKGDDKQKQNEGSPSKTAKKKEESNNVRLLRFQQLPNDETNTDEETNSQHKDVNKYYGIDQEKEQTKKPAFKLFRRDSKKEKKPKKVESGHSLDLAGNNGGQTKNGKKTQPSPILRKQRANTVHGDLAYPQPPLPPEESLTKSQQHSLSSKRVSQTSTSSIPPRDSISPVREESMSPPPTSPTPGNHYDPSQFTFDEYPELMPSEEADLSWNRTVDRRLRKQMSKHEKGRQGVIYDWITTERHICRTFLILKKLFYNRLQFELKMSEEELNQLFPSVNTLLGISKDFVTRLQDRQKQSGALIQDISDILLDQFTGAKGEEMKKAYTHFICLYPSTMEYYREMCKRRHFNRVISMIYQDKVCERKKLPDFYLLITQRVSKYVEMMKKLVKETEALKLNHLGRVRESSVALTELVNSIDRGVYEYNSNKELMDIQSRLEISVSKSAGKNRKLKDIKLLDFTVQNRFLLKRGDATWQGQLGQGKQTAVHVVLVTDFLVLLTERDQKYHLATLQDIQPPVIKLYDLHVRVNAAVKSGVQLLLVDQGELPEIFRVEFTHKKLAKEWEEALNSAIGYCKENGLKCEYFGAEPVLSGEENSKEDEEERPDSGGDTSNLSPSSYRRFIISMALEQAHSILTSVGPTSSGTFGGSMMTIDEVRESPRPVLKSNNKAQRSNTQRTVSVDESSKRKNKKGVERGKSFLDKKSNEDQLLERQGMIECISKLKESLEIVMEQNDEQDKIIQKLKKELDDYKLSDNSSNSPATPRSQRGSSFSRTRPHSLHSDLFEANNCAVK